MKRLLTICMSLLLVLSTQAGDDGQFFKKLSGKGIPAQGVVERFSEWFSLPAETEWREVSRTTDYVGMERIEYRQYVAGVEVEHSQVLIHAKDGMVSSANGTVMESKLAPAKLQHRSPIYKNGTPTDMMGQQLYLVNTKDGYRYAYKVISEDLHEWVYYDAETQEIIKHVPTRQGQEPLGDKSVKVKAKTIYNGDVELDASQTSDGTIYLYDQKRNIHTLCAAYLPTFNQLIEEGKLYDYYPQCDMPDNPKDATEEDFTNWKKMLETLAKENMLNNFDEFIIDNTDYIKTEQNEIKAFKLDNLVINQVVYEDDMGNLVPYTPTKKDGLDDDDDDDDWYDENGAGPSLELQLVYGTDPNNISVGMIEKYMVDLFELPPTQPLSSLYEIIPSEGATLIFLLKQGEGFYISTDTIAVIPIIPDESGKFEFANDRISLSLDYEPAGDPTADVHWGMGKTLDFYKEVFGRDSYDGNGSPVYNLVYNADEEANTFLGTPRCNAGALSSQSPYPMLYGMGGVEVFGRNMRPVVELSVMAHEFTHIITGFTAKLEYVGESGALNESFSDIMGINVKKYATNANDWYIGGDGMLFDYQMNFLSNLRDMADPYNNADGANPGPDTYQGSNWHDTSDTSEENDNGGVHTNSGVQNKWYYLLTDGGEGTNDNGDSYNVEGIGIERSRLIAYLTLTSYATRQSNYAAIRKASLEAAEVLFGANSVECQTVARAWDAVGVSESIQGIIDGISPIAVNSNKSSQVYDLQGRMVNNQPTTPGIYIKDGKKMVIK